MRLSARGQPIRTVIIGAGGHARVCIEAMLDDPRCEVVGCLDRSVDAAIPGVPRLGSDDDIEAVARRFDITHAFIAIGDNLTRSSWARRCSDGGITLCAATSQAAIVSRSARIGAGVLLAPGSVVNAGARVDIGAIVNTRASVDHDCIIGAFAHVAPGATLSGAVRVGARALVGIGASVVQGTSIGDGAVVGAGAVVLHDVPAATIVVGAPARPLDRVLS